MSLELDIKEIKDKLDKICHVLGIGRTPPATVIELKRYAEKKAEEINRRMKKEVKNEGSKGQDRRDNTVTNA